MPQGDLHRLHRPHEPGLPEGQAGEPPPGGAAIALRLDVGEAVLPAGRISPASLVFDGGVIAAVGSPSEIGSVDAEVVSRPDLLAVPGFVDLQCNGALGHSFWDPHPDVFEYLLRTGVTSLCPTLTTDARDGYGPALEALAALASAPRSLGVHLEGPFLNADRAGAHPTTHIVPPDLDWALSLLDVAPVAVWTLAPEMSGALDVVEALAGRGVVVSAGHTEATYDQMKEAVDRGLSMVTHLFNAQPPLHHREPGVVGAALDLPLNVGIILDGVHVREEVAKAALMVLGERGFVVTDAAPAAGLEEAPPRTWDGTLAGSVLRMDDAFRRAERLVGLEAAVRLLSTTPAAAVGRPDLGVLRPGAAADVVLLRDLSVDEVWVAGERQPV